MCGDRFSSSTTCSRWRHETEPGRLDQSLSCRFWKVATHPLKELEREVRELKRANEILRKAFAYFAQAELDRRRT